MRSTALSTIYLNIMAKISYLSQGFNLRESTVCRCIAWKAAGVYVALIFVTLTYSVTESGISAVLTGLAYDNNRSIIVTIEVPRTTTVPGRGSETPTTSSPKIGNQMEGNVITTTKKPAVVGTIDYQVPSWISTCTDVFIDLEANIGVQVKKLFEPEMYMKTQDSLLMKTLNLYNQEFGKPSERKRPNSGLCAFGFEPNPKHHSRLRDLEQYYFELGWKVHFFPFAVSNSDKNVTLYSDGEPEKNEWGATLYRDDDEFKGSTQVRQVRLSDFIKQYLNHVQIKVVKVDIEGAEYEVLVNLLSAGFLCQEHIKFVAIEWHTPRFQDGDLNNVYRNKTKLLKWINSQKCQPSNIEEINDESYLNDVYVMRNVVPPPIAQGIPHRTRDVTRSPGPILSALTTRNPAFNQGFDSRQSLTLRRNVATVQAENPTLQSVPVPTSSPSKIMARFLNVAQSPSEDSPPQGMARYSSQNPANPVITKSDQSILSKLASSSSP